MVDAVTDEELMQRFQVEGDLDAFSQLFRRHKDAFVRFLTGLSGEEAIAEDLSQQVWVKLIDVAKRGEYRKTAQFRTYLFTLGRNLYIDEYRRKHAATRTDSLGDRVLADDDPASEPAAGAALEQRRSMLRATLSTLPPEQREVLALWSAGVSTEAMTQITGAPKDTVLSRKKYAISKLRAAFAAAGVTGKEI